MPSEQLLEKIDRLPEERVSEVEDFIDFLILREQDRRLARSVSAASESALAKVWDNPEDDVYDKL